MPYKRRKPVSEDEMEDPMELSSEREMDKTRWEGHHSICQTLRDIYHITDNPDVKLRCRLAVAMAKAMNEKLKWYKQREETKV